MPEERPSLQKNQFILSSIQYSFSSLCVSQLEFEEIGGLWQGVNTRSIHPNSLDCHLRVLNSILTIQSKLITAPISFLMHTSQYECKYRQSLPQLPTRTCISSVPATTSIHLSIGETPATSVIAQGLNITVYDASTRFEDVLVSGLL